MVCAFYMTIISATVEARDLALARKIDGVACYMYSGTDGSRPTTASFRGLGVRGEQPSLGVASYLGLIEAEVLGPGNGCLRRRRQLLSGRPPGIDLLPDAPQHLQCGGLI